MVKGLLAGWGVLDKKNMQNLCLSLHNILMWVETWLGSFLALVASSARPAPVKGCCYKWFIIWRSISISLVQVQLGSWSWIRNSFSRRATVKVPLWCLERSYRLHFVVDCSAPYPRNMQNKLSDVALHNLYGGSKVFCFPTLRNKQKKVSNVALQNIYGQLAKHSPWNSSMPKFSIQWGSVILCWILDTDDILRAFVLQIKLNAENQEGRIILRQYLRATMVKFLIVLCDILSECSNLFLFSPFFLK